MLLLGVLATVTTLSLSGLVRGNRLDDAAAQLAMHDHLMRQRAQQFGQTTRLDLLIGRAQVIRLGGASAGESRPLRLAGGVRIERILIAGRLVDREDYGEVIIPCSAQGYTPSYAVLLAGSGNARRWIFVAGLTGQVTRMDDERQVQDTLQTLQATGP